MLACACLHARKPNPAKRSQDWIPNKTLRACVRANVQIAYLGTNVVSFNELRHSIVFEDLLVILSLLNQLLDELPANIS
jgi:hypothetical protein